MFYFLADVAESFGSSNVTGKKIDITALPTAPRSVRGANQLRIALYKPQPTKLVILVAQDNLVKGAAGQAVQNMNLMFGFAENAGLNNIGLLP